MKFEVTQEDIERGIPESACNCPVALSVKRQLGKECLIGEDLIIVDRYKLVSKELALPLNAVKFIADFDNLMPVKPFSFELDLS